MKKMTEIADLTAEVKAFAMEKEVDLVGIASVAAMKGRMKRCIRGTGCRMRRQLSVSLCRFLNPS